MEIWNRFIIFGMVVVIVGIYSFQRADAKTCFNIKTDYPVQNSTCGPVAGDVEFRNCETNNVEKRFRTLVGIDCKSKPISAKVLYGKEMLVGEYNVFNGVPYLILSKTFSMPYGKKPALEKNALKGNKCFSMTPLEKPNFATCAAVETQITMRDCSSKSPIGPMMDVKAHFTCKGKVKKLKYWYGDSLLVGVLGPKGTEGLGVKDTYSLIYPEIYGAIIENEKDNKRSTASEKQSPGTAESLKGPHAKNH